MSLTAEMEPQTIDKLIAFMMKAKTDANLQMKDPLAVMSRPHYEFSVDGEYFILGLKGIRAVNEVLKFLEDDSTIKARFTSRTLRKYTERLLAKITKLAGSNIGETVREATESMLQIIFTSPFKKWEVAVPILNLDLKIPSLDIGKVHFFKSDSESFNQHIAYVKNTTATQEVKDYLVEIIKKTFENRVVAIVEVEAADDEHALDNGSIEIEMALNILRFYGRGTQFNDSMAYRMFVGEEGNVYHGQYCSLSKTDYVRGPTEANVKIHFHKTGYLFEFTIDQPVIDAMKKYHFDAINEILLKEENHRTQFEQILLRSISFCGLGMNQIDGLYAFINFIISLESSLTNQWEPQKSLIGERTALIIANDPEERIDLFNEVGRMYQLRSDLFHQGSTQISQSDISILSYVVFQIIVKLIPLRVRVNNMSELAQEFNLLKFNGPPFSIT